MRITQLHPWTAVSAGMWTAALALPFLLFRLPVTFQAVMAVAALATPFMLLCVTHFRLKRTSRRHSFVVLLNLPLVFLWKFSLVLMWVLAPGLLGAVVLGTLLGMMALIGVWLTGFVRETPRGDIQPSPVR